MKTIITAFLFCLAFVVTKANSTTSGFKPNIKITPINNLSDYNVTFRFHRTHYPMPLQIISDQNQLAIETSETVVEIFQIEKDENDFEKISPKES